MGTPPLGCAADRRRQPFRRAVLAVAVTTLLVSLAACASSDPLAHRTPPSAVLPTTYDKIMIIPEENETDSSVIASPDAPYLNQLGATYGNATNMQAGYPTNCPSLAAYIMITSGGQQGICDDNPPAQHQLKVDNIFRQVATARLQWRQYSESMTSNCQNHDGPPGTYLVRHAPPPYYVSEAKRCQNWDVPMGTTSAGALHDDLATGLQAYSIVTANACDEMHGATTCPTNLIQNGDRWLSKWMPQIIASPDFQNSRLVVIITWDEGSESSNHIPTLIVSNSTHAVQSNTAFSHCSTLRTSEEILHLPYLGCAATATSFTRDFGF
jgi:phosphatidylinositol-3-phosphatase